MKQYLDYSISPARETFVNNIPMKENYDTENETDLKLSNHIKHQNIDP